MSRSGSYQGGSTIIKTYHKQSPASKKRASRLAQDRDRYQAELKSYEQRKAEGIKSIKVDELPDSKKMKQRRKTKRSHETAQKHTPEEQRRKEQARKRIEVKKSKMRDARSQMKLFVTPQSLRAQLVKIGKEAGLGKKTAAGLATEVLSKFYDNIAARSEN